MDKEYHRALAEAHQRLLELVRAAAEEHSRLPRSPLGYFSRQRSWSRFNALGDACMAIADMRVKALG